MIISRFIVYAAAAGFFLIVTGIEYEVNTPYSVEFTPKKIASKTEKKQSPFHL